MARFQIDREYLIKTLIDLLNTPSPTGDTEWAIASVEAEMEALDISTRRTTKGALIGELSGLAHNAPRALTAHVDTLGAMVKEIKADGRIKMTAIGGVSWPTMDSEGVTIATASGRNVRGSIVLHNGAVHVNPEGRKEIRTADNLEIRLDERARNKEEVALLGVEVGDFVYFDPRVEHSEAGFIRSRFLDDKACVVCVLAAFKALKDAGVSPAQDVSFLVSNFEEVGHGGCDALPQDLAEMLVLDMACVGEGQNGDEFHCSICLKDTTGPYSKPFSNRIRAIADNRGIDLKPDIYVAYGSDGSAYWRSGGTAQVALIGPGVDNSHCYERTHEEALIDTAALVAEYLVEDV